MGGIPYQTVFGKSDQVVSGPIPGMGWLRHFAISIVNLCISMCQRWVFPKVSMVNHQSINEPDQ